MVETVIIFAILNVVFEFVLLTMIGPRWRLRLLGSKTACTVLHFFVLALNLWIHFGTIVGTFSSICAFCMSMLTVKLARTAYGHVTRGVYYTGFVRFDVRELA